MPPQRAVTANTAAAATATARLVMARATGSTEAPSIILIQDNNEAGGDDGSDIALRVPSTRPIDQRWDRSRGILFGSTPRNPDSIRSLHGDIAFGSQYTQTRQYAQRALPTSRASQQPISPPKSQTTTLSDNPYHNPTPLRIASDSQKVVELAKEKDNWKAREAELILKHRKALESLDEQRKRARAREDDLDAELRRERASSQQQKRDHTRALEHERRNAVQEVEFAMSRLERQVATLTQLSNYFKRKTADLKQDIDRQDAEHKRDLVAQQRRLELSLSQELAEQTRQGQIRQKERATYEEYRKVYRELDEAIRDFYAPVLAMERALFAVVNRRGPPPTLSDGMNKINPIVLVSRGKLFRRLDEFQQALVVKHEEQGRSLQSLRYEMQEKYSDFSIAAHNSRTQSRYLRIDQTQTKMETADILHYVANDLPVRQELRAVEGEMKKLEASMDREQDETAKASLRAQHADLLTTRASLSSLVRLFARIREIATLEALQSDNIVEKEIFLACLEAESRIGQAGRIWSSAIGQSVFVNADSDVSVEDQHSTRSQYSRTLRQTHDRLDEYKEAVRKRAWLEQHLGLTKPDLEEKADATIRQRIEIQRMEERALLQKFGVERMSRSNSFARAASVSPTTRSTLRARRMEARASSEPPKPSTAINRTQSTTTEKAAAFGPSLTSMERNVSILKRRLPHLPDGTEKVLVAAELESLRRNIYTGKLSDLRLKRDVARKQNNEALQAKLQTNIVGIKAALAGVTKKANSPRTPVVRLHSSRPSISPTNSVFRRYSSRESKVRKFASTPPDGAVSAGRRTISTSSRSSSSPGLMSEVLPDSMAELDAIESAMQRTTISGSSKNPRHAPSIATETSDQEIFVSNHGSVPRASTADVRGSDNGSMPGDNGGHETDLESTLQPQFRIPDSAYREAALASQSSNAAFWSYRLYKDDKGKSPSVHYCTNTQQAERELQHFVGQPLIGFDMEWDSTANKTSHAKRNASLIQIACEDRICLIHIARFPSDNPDQLVTPTLRLILESTGTIKAGVNIQGDARRMREYLGTEVRAQFELSHLYKVVTFDRVDINKTLKGASMAVQVQKILRLPLKKDDVRVSAWARPLNQEQCDYSASDAYAGYQLFRELEAKREIMDPTPPRPAWAELKLPLVLGDGTMLRAKPKSSTAAAVKASTTPAEELDDDAEEDFYDAVETLDEIEALVVPLQGINISYPSLSTAAGDEANIKPEITENSITTTMPTIQPITTKDPPAPSLPELLSVSELDQADSWIASYRTTWRLQPGAKPQASVPNLRAHHLWHEQKLDTTQIAALLRDPPLSINTVASYILEAIRHEDLPFEPTRLREILVVMPEVVKVGRYRGIVEKMNEERGAA